MEIHILFWLFPPVVVVVVVISESGILHTKAAVVLQFSTKRSSFTPSEYLY